MKAIAENTCIPNGKQQTCLYFKKIFCDLEKWFTKTDKTSTELIILQSFEDLT